MINCGFEYSPDIETADIVIFDNMFSKTKNQKTKFLEKLRKLEKIKKYGLLAAWYLTNLKNDKNRKKQNPKFNKWNFIWNLSSKNIEILWLEKIYWSYIMIIKTPEDIEYLYINYSFWSIIQQT